MPAHPVALELIRLAGIPIAAPSANLFSHISPTSAAHVLEDLDGRIDAVLDAGPTIHGVESTVLDPCRSPMVLYRPGAITADQIRGVAGPVELFEKDAGREIGSKQPGFEEALPSPGVGLRHYAPRARLILIEDSATEGVGIETGGELSGRLAAAAARYGTEGLGIMLPAELTASAPHGASLFPWGAWSAPEQLAHQLYAGLRELDAQGCTVILCPVPRGDGIAAAIRDRLRKAAFSG
jgi:L-threonylcarbamoyladenylate synthase